MRDRYIDGKTLDTLRDLERSTGGDILRQVVEMYLQSTPTKLEMMQLQLAENNFQELSRTAHSLKSNSSTVGAVMMADFSRMMEEYLYQTSERRGAPCDPQYLAHLLRKMQVHCELTCRLLREEELSTQIAA